MPVSAYFDGVLHVYPLPGDTDRNGHGPAIRDGAGPCAWCRLLGAELSQDCDDARASLHGYDACNEAWEAHSVCCCRRCHQVAAWCGYSADPHEYPHPSALAEGLIY